MGAEADNHDACLGAVEVIASEFLSVVQVDLDADLAYKKAALVSSSDGWTQRVRVMSDQERLVGHL